jgi:hypothetical protein
MALSTGYIAAAVPAQIVRVSSTTLFHLAQEYLGDAMRWPAIAQLNGMTDPWITGMMEIKIPPTIDRTVTPTGILGA